MKQFFSYMTIVLMIGVLALNMNADNDGYYDRDNNSRYQNNDDNNYNNNRRYYNDNRYENNRRYYNDNRYEGYGNNRDHDNDD